MSDLIKKDPLRTMFTWPRWFDDWDDAHAQRGLKIRETESDILVEAVVAGVPADDVEIHIEDGVLSIKAEIAEETKDKDSYHSSSYSYYYTAALSGGQWDKAEAEIEHGVLTLAIPKQKAARKQKVKVKTKAK